MMMTTTTTMTMMMMMLLLLLMMINLVYIPQFDTKGILRALYIVLNYIQTHHYTDTGPPSSQHYPNHSRRQAGFHWSTNVQVTGMTRL